MAAKYRMTPKRRAALHRAQLASARKRRKSRNKKIVIGAGIVSTVAAVGVLGYAGRDYVKHLRRPYRPSVFNPTHQLALPPGQKRKVIMRRPRPVHKRNGAFRVTTDGTASYIKRPRGKYDAKRRAGLVSGYEKKVRSKYDGMSPRTQRRKRAKRG